MAIAKSFLPAALVQWRTARAGREVTRDKYGDLVLVQYDRFDRFEAVFGDLDQAARAVERGAIVWERK